MKLNIDNYNFTEPLLSVITPVIKHDKLTWQI
jgi:hypothetical protein